MQFIFACKHTQKASLCLCDDVCVCVCEERTTIVHYSGIYKSFNFFYLQLHFSITFILVAGRFCGAISLKYFVAQASVDALPIFFSVSRSQAKATFSSGKILD